MDEPHGAILVSGSAGKFYTFSGNILESFLVPVVTIPRPISTATSAYLESSKRFTTLSLIRLQSKSNYSLLVITTVMGLLLPVRSCPHLKSSSVSQGLVLRKLKILGSKMCYFCRIRAICSIINEKTSFRPFLSASSILAWNNSYKIYYFLIDLKKRIQFSIGTYFLVKIKIISTGTSNFRAQSLVTTKILRY